VHDIETSLMSSLTGRFWAGKDAVLKATVALAKLSPIQMLSKIPKVIERFMRECGREQESIVYARESVTQLGLLLESAPTIDSYAIVEPLLMNIIITKGTMAAVAALAATNAAAAATVAAMLAASHTQKKIAELSQQIDALAPLKSAQDKAMQLLENSTTACRKTYVTTMYDSVEWTPEDCAPVLKNAEENFNKPETLKGKHLKAYAAKYGDLQDAKRKRAELDETETELQLKLKEVAGTGGETNPDGSRKQKSKTEADPAMHARAVECLGSAFPYPDSSTAVATQTEVVPVITKLLTASIQASVWRVRVAIATTAGKVLVKIVPSVGEGGIQELVRCLRVAADDIKFHQVRRSSIISLLNFLNRAGKDAAVAKMCVPSVPAMKGIIRLLRDDGDPMTAQKAGEAALALEKIDTA